MSIQAAHRRLDSTDKLHASLDTENAEAFPQPGLVPVVDSPMLCDCKARRIPTRHYCRSSSTRRQINGCKRNPQATTCSFIGMPFVGECFPFPRWLSEKRDPQADQSARIISLCSRRFWETCSRLPQSPRCRVLSRHFLLMPPVQNAGTWDTPHPQPHKCGLPSSKIPPTGKSAGWQGTCRQCP